MKRITLTASIDIPDKHAEKLTAWLTLAGARLAYNLSGVGIVKWRASLDRETSAPSSNYNSLHPDDMGDAMGRDY